MELNIKKWEYKKVMNEEFKINLPETEFCFHDWNGRVRTLVRPQYTTWKVAQGADKEELIGYNIVKVSFEDAKIEKGYLAISGIEDILSKPDSKGLFGNDKLSYDITQYITYHFGIDAVKFEYFKEGYDKVLNKLNELVK
jgi:hypothetical protein